MWNNDSIELTFHNFLSDEAKLLLFTPIFTIASQLLTSPQWCNSNLCQKASALEFPTLNNIYVGHALAN